MRQIKKTLSIFMAALFVMAGVLGNVTTKAATVTVPVVNYIGVSHSPLVEGDTEVFTVTSVTKGFEGLVQYRAFLYNGTEWKELTNGYSKAVDSKTPFVLPETPAFKLGAGKLSVWVKRADTTGINKNANGDFDSYKVANLNCVKKDDANRVYANGKANYTTTGLTFKFDGIEGISGIEGPYVYRLHFMNAATGEWTNRATEYTETPSYKFEKAGTYMVVVHANTAKSVTWAKYQAEKDKSIKNQTSTYGTYEAWKTIMVTVKESALPTAKVEKALYNAALFSTYVQVSLDTTTPADYAVTINGVKATMFTDKSGNKLFDANIKGEVKAEDVKVEVVSTVVVKPEVAKSKVEKALYNAALFSTYVQVSLDTTTPESYKVTINGAEATMFTNKDGIKLFDANVKGEVKSTDVVVVVTVK